MEFETDSLVINALIDYGNVILINKSLPKLEKERVKQALQGLSGRTFNKNATEIIELISLFLEKVTRTPEKHQNKILNRDILVFKQMLEKP